MFSIDWSMFAKINTIKSITVRFGIDNIRQVIVQRAYAIVLLKCQVVER